MSEKRPNYTPDKVNNFFTSDGYLKPEIFTASPDGGLSPCCFSVSAENIGVTVLPPVDVSKAISLSSEQNMTLSLLKAAGERARGSVIFAMHTNSFTNRLPQKLSSLHRARAFSLNVYTCPIENQGTSIVLVTGEEQMINGLPTGKVALHTDMHLTKTHELLIKNPHSTIRSGHMLKKIVYLDCWYEGKQICTTSPEYTIIKGLIACGYICLGGFTSIVMLEEMANSVY